MDFDLNIIPQFTSIVQQNLPNLALMKKNKNNSTAREERKLGAPLVLPSLLTEIDGLNLVKDQVTTEVLSLKQSVR